MASATLVHTLKSHSSDVNCCCFSATTIASCSGDKSVRLWNLEDFKELPISPLLGHTYYVHWCVFSPFGTVLASCSTDGKIILWDARTGESQVVLQHPSKAIVRVCSFSPNSEMLLTGAADSTLCLWNVQKKSLIRTFDGHENVITACTFTPDSSFVVSACASGDLRIWDALYGHTKSLFFDPECHDLGVSCLVISPTFGSADPNAEINSDRRAYLLATCGGENLVKLWDLIVFPSCKTKVRCSLTGHTAKVMAVAFSPDGSLLASGAVDKIVIVWNPIEGSMLYTLEEHSRYVTTVAFSPDGRYLASGSNDRTVKVWLLHAQGEAPNLPAPSGAQQVTGTLQGTDGASSMNVLLEWSIDDVCDWLKAQGLEEYVQSFRDNRIDGQELQSLNTDTLVKDLGVKALGHRQKILRGVQIMREKGSSGIILDDGIPDEYLCPITRELMRDPVIAADGFSYERSSIESWIRGNKTSPMTNSPLVHTNLTPNRSLKMIIQRLYNL
ncbi:WD repeat, SAM and U-box domain-containing protein 1-like [Acanthaster planci]|uniref:WD repeat, SAM and U-box domain-containing protein 1 n=1 Tax=Acanthaster planci TaxID=133434 RepID=A0A8B7XW43_ACAPL|nr:WD repeat, SAM and U-box domain-containing protein 1-like [Acanthaster planci]XP_022084470.1 WD repeat, SAM and U-box domain-containing protein 1-like [Acanthaster planci]XP_022084478.1 WD repeat, SAM and U-box domain-containing protein 1-like [Acanthaster planci]